MPYEPFFERFPKLAEKETRTITTSGHPYLPDDEYALIEAYCNEPNCDCRRVFFNVGARRRGKILAVIAYGWESKKYYAKWFGNNPPGDILEELQGPALNSASPQSDLAPALLLMVKQVLQDKDYVNRLKRHYEMFKETVDVEVLEDPEDFEYTVMPKIGRNDPCSCGSGKKYKNCCNQK